jgi:Cell wall-associated hydrolases (invasion-associated proteins)
MWDATANQIVIKAIGTVESNLDYGAINPSDAITLGVAQWYGTRAAGLLFHIKVEATTSFDDYCPDTIKDAMLAHPATDPWWNGRHVTREETARLRTLLTRADSKIVQNVLLIADVAGYLDIAAQWGLDKDTETLATEFFCTIYHQSPRAASQICSILPTKATLENIYQAAINNDIVGDYRSRQDTAYNIISNQEPASDTPPDDVIVDEEDIPDGGDGGDGGNGGKRRRSKDLYMVDRGNVRVLYHKNGSTTTFYKSGGVYLAADGSAGAKYTNNNPDPDPDTNNDNNDGETPPATTNPSLPKGTASDIITFARSKLLDFSYSQGPGRMTPEISGYTDCSAFLVYAFQKGGNVSLGGTYTGNLCTRGRLVKDGAPTEAEMNPGDLIFLRWGSTVRSNSPFDHVELYCGGGTRISMGRTPGPTEAAWNVDINAAMSNSGRVQIRRYL